MKKDSFHNSAGKKLDAGDVLVVIAMPEEAQGAFADVGSRVVYTGIGKVNASYALTKAIFEMRPSAVINFGTAGSPRFSTRSLVECTRFVQRDMDVRPLGFARGVTPFDPSPAVFSNERRFNDLPEGICGTGDNFETALPPASEISTAELPMADCPTPDIPTPDIIDMECYALAKICWREGIPFVAVKYVTDGSDASASQDWAANLPLAAAAFRRVYDRLLASG